MLLTLINIGDADKISKVAQFSLTQEEINDDFIYFVERKVAKILNINWEHVYVKDQDKSSLNAMELFIDNGHSFNIMVGKHKYAVIPS